MDVSYLLPHPLSRCQSVEVAFTCKVVEVAIANLAKGLEKRVFFFNVVMPALLEDVQGRNTP